MNKISIEISTDPFSNYERRLEHKELLIKDNLEMAQKAEVVFYNDGEKVVDLIRNDNSLTESQKTININRFKNQIYASETSGSFVDVATGAAIIADENGGFPEDITIVSELEFWQQLPAVFFSGRNLNQIAPHHQWKSGDTLADLVYNGIQFSMMKMADRNKV